MQEILILTNLENKKRYLEENSSTLFQRKVMTFQELKENLTYSYDERAIYEVMKEKNVSYEIATLYLRNLCNCDETNSLKILFLTELYHQLEKKNLLIYHPLFDSFLERQQIQIYGKTFLTKEEEKLLTSLSYEMLKRREYEREIPLYELETLEDEVYFLASSIVKLLKNGVEPKKIFVVNLNDEYKMAIEKIFPWYHIPTNIALKQTIYGTPLVKKFLSISDMEVSLNQLKEEIHNSREEQIFHKIENIVGKYADLKQDKITRKCVIEELKKSHVSFTNLENAVEEGTLSTFYDEDCYVFVVGCNETVLPVTYKDEDYLSDKEKELLGWTTSKEKNIEAKKELLEFIKHTKNITLSYKKKTLTDTFYKASFLEEIPVSLKTYIRTYQDSHFVNELCLGKMLDNHYKYHVEDPDLAYLFTHYENIPYRTYQNQFTRVDLEKLREVMKDTLLLSYSSLDTYYRCSFRYYVEKVLKLNVFEDTFLQNLGTLFHYVLSKAFLPDFDFEKEWNTCILENHMGESKKEVFFLKKLKEELKFIIAEIHRQYQYTSLKDAFYEEAIYIHPTNEDNITFMGIIDKLLYNRETNTVAVIDYKTGNPNLNLANVPYGIEMQLPIYLYLVNHFTKIQNPKIAGFYLQKILHNEIARSDKKTYLALKRENLLLQGYSTANEEVLEEFDSNYAESFMVKGLRMSSKGFYAYSKVLTEEEMTNLLKMVEEKINKAIFSIRMGDFTINPKRIGFDNLGCEFCQYRDLCYHMEKDIVNLKEYQNLDFLGGEKDA